MNTLSTILFFILTLAIILVASALCKKYIFSKVRISKWIPLSIAIVLFVVQYIVQYIMGVTNIFIAFGLTIFAVLFFLWFMHIIQTGGVKSKEKQIVIKPKAKPNRVKKDK